MDVSTIRGIIVLLVFFSFFAYQTYKAKKKGDPFYLSHIFDPLIIIILLLCYLCLILWPQFLTVILNHLSKTIGSNVYYQYLTVFLAFLLSFGLFRLKQFNSSFLGVIEISGGIFTIWYTITEKDANQVTTALGWAGGIFLMTKGLENLKNGGEKGTKFLLGSGRFFQKTKQKKD